MAILTSTGPMGMCDVCEEWWDPLRLVPLPDPGVYPEFRGESTVKVCPQCHPELFGGKKWPVGFHE